MESVTDVRSFLAACELDLDDIEVDDLPELFEQYEIPKNVRLKIKKAVKSQTLPDSE